MTNAQNLYKPTSSAAILLQFKATEILFTQASPQLAYIGNSSCLRNCYLHHGVHTVLSISCLGTECDTTISGELMWQFPQMKPPVMINVCIHVMV